MFNHSFTWLKVLAVAFIAEYFLFCRVSRNFITDWDSLLIPIAFVIIGLFVGFLINAFSNFKKPILVYTLGHLIVVSCFVYSSIVDSSKEDRKSRKERLQDAHIEILNVLFPGDENSQAREKILKTYEKEFPDNNYEITQMIPYPIDSTQPNSNERIVYLVYYSANEPSQEYFSKFIISQDSVRVVYQHIYSANPLFQECIQKQRLDLADSVLKRIKAL